MEAKDFRKKAWNKFRDNQGTMIVILLVVALIEAVLSFTFIGTIVIAGPLALGVAGCTLALCRKQKFELVDMFKGFNNFVPACLLYIVNTIFVGLWSILFIVPGIIAELSYSMSFYILQDNPKMTQSEARNASISMMNGHKWELFCLRFSFIGWILLGILTFGILFIWVAPYMNTAEAEFYRHLKGESDVEISEAQNSTDEAIRVEVKPEDIKEEPNTTSKNVSSNETNE
mgnify:FL=1